MKKAQKKLDSKSIKKVAKKAQKKSSAKKVVSSKNEIIQLILADHKPLKQLIKILKKSENPIAERQEAFKQFADVLGKHAYAEEHALYKAMEKIEDLKEECFEGEVEHNLSDQMVASAKSEQDENMWSAKVKVLAELVEHHVKEEEEEMLPDVRKKISLEKRVEIGQKYQELKKSYLTHNISQAPREEDDEILEVGEKKDKMTQPTSHH